MIKIRPIANFVGILLMFLGLLMLSCLFFSVDKAEGLKNPFLQSGLITIVISILLLSYRRGSLNLAKREGYLIVALGWFSMAAFSTLPYILSGAVTNYTDAFFEAVSGLTTTGATIFQDLSVVPRDLLFWRSVTQWVGGMGIIVLTVAVFPLLGIGGIELFVAEAPGPTSDKIHPRIKETARRLWMIYVALTGLLMITLLAMGVSFFDSINHAMTCMATGGFSTYNESVAHFGPAIQVVFIVFMFLAGNNFTVTYFALKGKFRRVWQSEEFRSYVFLVVAISLVVTGILIFRYDFQGKQALLASTFQVVSIMTTTGYVTADYTTWGSGLTMFFFILLFTGACAGSTSGGIKLIRHLVFFKNSILEFKRILHPRAMIRLKINKEIVSARILTHILVFLLIYLAIFVIGSITVGALGMDFISASGAVATSLGNVGPAVGSVGPVNNFAAVPWEAKWVLGFLMLLGRLELFTILVLFTPYFWKSN